MTDDKGLWCRVGLACLLTSVGACSGTDDGASRGRGGDGDGQGQSGPLTGDGDGAQDPTQSGPGAQDPGPQSARGTLSFSCGDLCSNDSVGAAGTAPFDTAMDRNERVRLDPDGALVLDRDAGPAGPSVIWIADQGAVHTVLKVDTETMQQLARYRVGPNGLEDPSRTAVDAAGNVYVGNRGGEGDSWQGKGLTSITKVLNEGCPDLDGNGMVTTSTGPDDVLPWGQDECVVWHVPFPHDVRAIAAQDVPAQTIQQPDGEMLIPAEHYVWVSGMNGGPSPGGQMATLRKLDAQTGQTVLETEAYPAYGMALDGLGNLWLDRAIAGGGVQRIDTTQCVDAASCAVPYCQNVCNDNDCTARNDGCARQLITGMPGGLGYGITVDHKQRVWIGGYGGDVLKRYDQLAPENQRFASGNIPGINGIAADGNGFVWGARRGTDWLAWLQGQPLGEGVVRIDAETFESVLAAPGDAKGMAVDRQGKVWAISQANYATVIVPGPTLQDNAVSQPITTLSNPYTYSDMTGQQTRLASGDPGMYTRLFEGCADADTAWAELAWDADLPPLTMLRFSVRGANAIADLPAQPWINLAVAPPDISPVALTQVGAARYLEVEVQLVANDPNDPALTPRVLGFGAAFTCNVLQ